MTAPDQELEERLAALEARAPANGGPPTLHAGRRRSRLAVALTAAPLLLLAVVATAAGAVVATNLAKGHEGIQNPGQPLAGAHMECMTPPEAAAFLAAHGYRDVVWQVESGELSNGGQKGASASVQQASPPEHGYVVPGSILDDGRLHMVVDQRRGATGSGACPDRPMP